MEAYNHALYLLDMIPYPAFLVENGTIQRINDAATETVQIGMSVDSFITTGKQEYAEMGEGVLYLSVKLNGISYGASVLRTAEYDIFLLDINIQDSQLQIIALAAQEIRKPLASLMTVSDRYFSKLTDESSEETNKYIAQMNHSLYQMLRVVGNMADADRYQRADAAPMRSWNISSILKDLFHHAEILIEASSKKFQYDISEHFIFGAIDKEKFERAIYNLISNAAKFSPAYSTITASVTRKDQKLYFTIENKCDSISLNPQKIFTGFMRRPGVEDGRMGIGLGMMLVRSTATAHNGTVLVTQPDSDSVRFTFSIELKEEKNGILHSPMPLADYAGERDHGLIELSDFLPSSEYMGIN